MRVTAKELLEAGDEEGGRADKIHQQLWWGGREGEMEGGREGGREGEREGGRDGTN